jgi:hypothetical protein
MIFDSELPLESQAKHMSWAKVDRTQPRLFEVTTFAANLNQVFWHI